MRETASVVTPQRYAQGYLYDDYLRAVRVNRERFLSCYDKLEIDAAESARFRRLAAMEDGPRKALVIGEDWCPDVYRGLPTIAKLAATADVELRVFPRDSNQDVMNEFLKEGKYQSIPTAVFFTDDLRYICHWIERPELANREQAEIEAAIKRERPEIDQRAFGVERRNRFAARFPAWQRATIIEINDMLSQALAA